jgi:hypothetical protein
MATAWRCSTLVDGNVFTLQALEESLLVGGLLYFTNPDSQRFAAELELRTGNRTSWDPRADDLVRCLGLDGDTIFLGGNFSQVGGVERKFAAAVNRYTAQLLPWNPAPNGQVASMAVGNGTVYIGGGFKSVGVDSRLYLAAVDAESGRAKRWQANLDSGALTMQLFGDILYVGGSFERLEGEERLSVMALDTRLSSDNALNWRPTMGNQDFVSIVNAIAVTDGSVFLGGSTPPFNNGFLQGFDLPTRFQKPLYLPGGLFRLNFIGPLGYYYVFESSTDLKNWTPILTNRPPLIFEDLTPLTDPQRFYRAKPLP